VIDPMQIVSLIIGTSGVAGSILAFRKARPEARKMDADTAAVIATTAGKWVMDADDRMAELAAELRTIQHNQRRHDQLLTVHAQWDRQVIDALAAAGISHLPSAPPIYLPQTG